MGVVLTTYEVLDQRAATLAVLLDVFEQVGADACLVGGIAVGYHARPRATVDVDFLVPKRKLGPIAKALAQHGYAIAKREGIIRVYAPGGDPEKDEPIADLVAREANATLTAAAKATEPAVILGHKLRVVRRGALVALKFHAAISRTRPLGDRYIDVGDLEHVARTRFGADDRALALKIAETIYPGAEAELAQMLDDLKNNRPVKI